MDTSVDNTSYNALGIINCNLLLKRYQQTWKLIGTYHHHHTHPPKKFPVTVWQIWPTPFSPQKSNKKK